ncbi:hypothetical protein MNBD_GAMMA04-2226 [hydrothermal vent metagenome]|uniref:NHL repeat domain protein n=1 Tax=hydrothermal vent metagenome TaxID=652676 RepID=A0A3B0VXA3_9ZZZZ
MFRSWILLLCLITAPFSARSEILEEFDSIDSFRIISAGWLSTLVGTEFEYIESPISVVAKDNKIYFIDDVLMGLFSYNLVSQEASNLKKIYRNLKSNQARLFMSDDQELFVIDSFASQVSKYDLLGNLINRFYNPLNLNAPVGMCINPLNNHVLIADAFFGHVIEFSSTGDPLALHGIKEKGGVQAGSDIVGMACTQTEMFIVSKLTKSINVFSFAGEFLRQIPRPEVRSPTAVAVDSYGRIYISDDFSDQISIYNNRGFLKKFGRSGVGPMHFREIKDLSIDGDYLYVADNMNRSIKILTITPSKTQAEK